MALTQIARLIFSPRQKEIEHHAQHADATQRQILSHLIGRARDTEYGRNHHFGSLRSYDDFARSVPVNTYEELKADIDRMRHGETNVLWPGSVRWYAKSSGTTNDKSPSAARACATSIIAAEPTWWRST